MRNFAGNICNTNLMTMKKPHLPLLLSTLFALLPLMTSAGEYRNPVIPGYHPDPSVCRVGDTYYLVNSSFQYFPGVPVFQSKDLVNWEQIGNVLTRDSQLPLKGATSWLGIYAPTIRYHEGTYYMITTNVGGGGNFMVTATDPRGPWSEPIWLKQQGIDPSLYFEDGKCYMVSNPGDAIWLCEIDPKTGEQLTESKQLWSGDGGRYPEGPHIYKKDGYYYLLISEGGTELAHSLTIARSRNIYGPYESNPANPILTNCSRKGQTKQIQGTGHGDFIQSLDGHWWMVLLAYRNFSGSYHHMGRETYLAPVEWPDGEWPVVNGGEALDTIVTVSDDRYKSPPAQYEPQNSRTLVEQARLETEANKLKHVGFYTDKAFDTASPEWIYQQNPIAANYTWTDRFLTLRPHGTLTENNQPTFVGRRQEKANFSLETTVSLKPKTANKKTSFSKQSTTSSICAGLSVYQINDGHFDIVATDKGVEVRCKLKNIEYIVASVALPTTKDVVLRINSDGTMYNFMYSTNGTEYRNLCSLNCSLLSTEVAGGFTGVTLGMIAEGTPDSGSATFKSYKYQEFVPIQ